jgi:flagellar export protein FliJ
MAQFKFKLAAVLRHRSAIEKEKQRDYALALAAVKQLEDELKALNATMQSTSDDVRDNRLLGRLDINFITAHRRFLFGVQRKAMDLVTRIAAAQRTAETARQVMAEAAKNRMVLEKLRDTQQQRWKDETDRKEAAALDEVSMQMFTHDPNP